MRGLTELPIPFGQTVSLDTFLTFDTDRRVWMPIVQAGVWYHPRYGEVPITADDIRTMHANFKSNLHPLPNVQLAIDYEHLSTKTDRKPGDGEAAAWVHDLEVRNNGLELWALVEYTDTAAEKVKSRKYRYFSPTFTPNHQCMRDGKEIGPTLLGGALTNFPTLPLPALTLSTAPLDEQIATRRPVKKSGAANMKTIKIKDKDGNDVEVPVDVLTLDALSDVPAVVSLRERAERQPGQVVSLEQFTTVQTTVNTLSAEVDRLKGENVTYKQQAEAAKKAATEATVNGLIAEGRALPTEKDELIELSTVAPAMFDKTVARRKAADPIIIVNQEHGSGTLPNSSSAVVQFDSLVDDMKTKNPTMQYAACIKEVAKKNPDLAKRRNQELSRPIATAAV